MSTTLLRDAPELIAAHAHMRAAAGRRHPDQVGPFCIGFDPDSNDPSSAAVSSASPSTTRPAR